MSDRSRSVQVRFEGFAIGLAIDITPRSQEALVWSARGDIDRLDTLIVETLSIVHLAGFDLAIVNRIAVLALVKLLPHHMVQITAAKVQDLAEWLPEVSVQGRVDDRVQQAVAITEPEKQAG